MGSRWTLTSSVASWAPWRLLPARDAIALRSLLSEGVSLYYSTGEYAVVASYPPGRVEYWARKVSRDQRVSLLSSRFYSGKGNPWLMGVGARLGLEWLKRLEVVLERPTGVVLGEGEGGWFAAALAPQHHWLLDKCRPRGKLLRQVLGFDLHLGEWRGGPSRVRVQGDVVAWVHVDGLDGPPAWLFHAIDLSRRAVRVATALDGKLSNTISRVVVSGDQWRAVEAVEETLRSTASGKLLAGLLSPTMAGKRLVVGLEPEAGEVISEVLGVPRGVGERALTMAARDPSSLATLVPDYAASAIGYLLSKNVKGETRSRDGLLVNYAPILIAASLLEASGARPRIPPPVRVHARLGRHSIEYYGWILGEPASSIAAAASLTRGLAAVAGIARGRGCFWLGDASAYLGWRREAMLHIALDKVRIKHPEHGVVNLEGSLIFTLTTINLVRF